MAAKRPLRLVLLWHMHQPDFRDLASGEFAHPWVYLHAIKDYTDMAAHLESHPQVHAVVNLVPVLLDQLEDYSDQFGNGRIRDPLLRLLAQEDLERASTAERELILHQCFRANHAKMIEPYTPYKRLRDLYQSVIALGGEPAHYLSGGYLADLLTWYHLAWMGETVRRKEECVVQLMTRGQHFTHADRMRVFDLIGQLIRDIIPPTVGLPNRGVSSFPPRRTIIRSARCCSISAPPVRPPRMRRSRRRAITPAGARGSSGISPARSTAIVAASAPTH